MSTTPAELLDFAEAPGLFMQPGPKHLLHVEERFVLSAEIGHRWTAVERVRLEEADVELSVARVDAFMRKAGTVRASWWLSERSTPGDVEEQLLAAGCKRDEADYLHAAMVLTCEPPVVDGIEARRLETTDERQKALAVQQAIFGAETTSEPDYAT